MCPTFFCCSLLEPHCAYASLHTLCPQPLLRVLCKGDNLLPCSDWCPPPVCLTLTVFTDPGDGTNHTAGLSLITTVAVPPLNIPATTVSISVASAAGAVAQSVVMQVRSLGPRCSQALVTRRVIASLVPLRTAMYFRVLPGHIDKL